MAVQATSAVFLLIGLLGSTVRAQFQVFIGAEERELELFYPIRKNYRLPLEQVKRI